MALKCPQQRSFSAPDNLAVESAEAVARRSCTGENVTSVACYVFPLMQRPFQNLCVPLM